MDYNEPIIDTCEKSKVNQEQFNDTSTTNAESIESDTPSHVDFTGYDPHYNGSASCERSVPQGVTLDVPLSPYSSTSPVLLRRGTKNAAKRLANLNLSEEISSDDYSDQSDDDVGVYAESYRQSRWVQVNISCKLNSVARDEVADDAFASLDCQQDSVNMESKTSGSHSDVPRYKRIRKCVVLRQNSRQEFYRHSHAFYDSATTVIIEKGDKSDDFGLHIFDSHPAYISAVDKGSNADRAGVCQGHVVVSVNGSNVLQSTHQQIVALLRTNPSRVELQLVSVTVAPSRDLQAPVHTGYLTKLSGSPKLLKLWRRRWFVLRQDNCLYYYKTEQDLDPLGAIPLQQYRLSKAHDINKPNAFKLENYGMKTLYIVAADEADMSRWTGVISNAAMIPSKTPTWLDITTHNVGLPALSITDPDCTGYLNKLGQVRHTWQRRFCVLNDACLYYYKSIASPSARGMAHFHGYSIDACSQSGRRFTIRLIPPDEKMRQFMFSTENETDMLRWIEALRASISRWICIPD